MSCLFSRTCHSLISVSSSPSHLPIFVILTQLFSSCLSFSPSSFTVSLCLFHVKSPLSGQLTPVPAGCTGEAALNCHCVCQPWGTPEGPAVPEHSPVLAHPSPQRCHSRVCLQLPTVLFCLPMVPELCPCTAPHPGMAPERCLVLGLRPPWTQPYLGPCLGEPLCPQLPASWSCWTPLHPSSTDFPIGVSWEPHLKG